MLKKLIVLASFSLILVASTTNAQETQQIDVGFGVGTLFAPSSPSSSSYSPQGMGGGTYLDFSGDYIFWHNLGVQGEVAWRASESLYGGYQPFRPIFYDFNAIYAPRLGKHAQLELLGGLGGLSTRFYTQNYTCDYYTYTCTNYVSSNHFMGDVGAAIRLYVHGGVFVRPEVREYFIHNNQEFASGHATRADVSIGYTFGR